MLPEQNLPWWRHDRPWGFRFSAMDAAIFAGGAIATAVAWQLVGPFALVVPFLLAHFFLFCNVFRIGGERSLIWAAVLLANAFAWPHTSWLSIHLAIQLAATVLLIANCVMGANYHGFACDRINPTGYRMGAMTEGSFTRHVLLGCRVPRRMVELLTGRKLEEFDE